ncbi:nucleic-acid-binding protein from transposon X-element [Trichonephila clavipes]|uniref:Nucleic-acid-binding protein from transposon X-element n=1 Tax=Trichonephila clavipes TaxID=2585209 RepID=A0A8X6RZD4_TRICX|nr:nucleic-acid-binding protein from transposon X-element [Trichonephila clavipes]
MGMLDGKTKFIEFVETKLLLDVRYEGRKVKACLVETANRFSNLQIEDPPNLENEQDERDEDVPQPKPPRFRPPPPITIDNVNNSAAFLKQLQNMTQENLMGRIIGKGLRVYPKTPQAYHKIRSFIDHEKLESYTYQLNEEKELKVVIRGMPSDMPPQQIIEGLSELGLTINDCHVMINRKTGLPMPLFLLSLPKKRTQQGRLQHNRIVLHENQNRTTREKKKKKAQPNVSAARGFPQLQVLHQKPQMREMRSTAPHQ